MEGDTVGSERTRMLVVLVVTPMSSDSESLGREKASIEFQPFVAEGGLYVR